MFLLFALFFPIFGSPFPFVFWCRSNSTSYDGAPDINTAPFKSRGVTFMDRFRSPQEDREHYGGQDDGVAKRILVNG